MTPPPLTTLRLEATAPVAHLQFHRPERLNALSRVMLSEIIVACQWLDTRPDIKVVIVSGAGRALCAGFDLEDYSSSAQGQSPRDTADLGRRAGDALANMEALTIVAVHGHCVGGGVVLTAACDLRLAADTATFSIPEVDLGIPLAWAGIPRLVREIGPAFTKELVLTCRPFGAQEAHGLRFVNRVVPADDLMYEAQLLADSLAAKPSFALRTTKQQVNAVTDEMIATGRNANDADSLVVAMHDPESRAVAAAYLAQRGR